MRVAFIGPMHSGKTTAAKVLQDLYLRDFGEPMPRVSFAGPLKEMAEAFFLQYFGVQIDINQFKNTQDGRKFLQLLGRLGRSYDVDFWVKLAQPQLDSAASAVVDDCRFMNEAEALRRNGFTLVRMWRPQAERKKSVTDVIMREEGVDRKAANKLFEEQGADDSETEQEGIVTDITLKAGTVDNKKITVEQAVKEFYEEVKRER